MENNWAVFNSDYFHKEVANQMCKLPVAVYLLQQQVLTDILYLTQLEKEFSLPPKIYGVEESFINRVVKTYKHTTGNLGVLMNGVKGTGKTLTAKQIANELGLPVIVIKDNFEETPDFLNSLQEDVVVFFDEYEKVYDDYDHSILTVMDGVLTTEWRKLFLLTTNNAYVNENMLQRPGRIRYYKTFSDLTLENIIEVVDDQLVNKKFKDEVVKFLSNLEIITIDIVTTIIEEINIHNELPEAFKDVFNVRALDDVFDVFTLSPEGKQVLLYQRVKIDPIKPTRQSVGMSFRVNGVNLGKIVESLKDLGFKVETVGKPRILDVSEEVADESDERWYLPDETQECEVDADGKKKKYVTTYIIERSAGIHKVFSAYAF